ncbi:MAG: hypothetical protein EX271_07740 [Acidimicrobiales bacterium]|nr:MAG: hypothetical protein EX271_07740 [Acidimicrobiales bacterium]
MFSIMLSVFLPSYCLASSAELSSENISDAIEITMDRTESKSDICKSAKRSISNKCGQTYIFPRITQHPDSSVSEKINTFIAAMESPSVRGVKRMESWTEVTLNKENILSLSYSSQLYGQVASATRSVHICSNLDLVSGDQIVLAQILKPGFQSKLPRLISENLQSKLKYKLPRYVRSLLSQKGADWTLKTQQSFLLDKQDLSLCFEQGELSDEAIGPIMVALPYTIISGLIDENGPLAFVLDRPISNTENDPENLNKIVAAPPPPPSTPESPVPEKTSQTADRIGSIDHSCIKGNVTHSISVVEYDADSPFICMVEYDKTYEQKVLWRSRKTKSFCHSNAEKLVKKYEEQWGYTCGRSSTLPDN